MADMLLTVAETAALLEIGERAVRKNALAGKYGELRYTEIAKGGSGGKALRISLDALPEEYQARYIEEHGLGAQEEAAETVHPYDVAPDWAREKAHRNHFILEEYEEYIRFRKGSKVELTNEFVEDWNRQNPH